LFFNALSSSAARIFHPFISVTVTILCICVYLSVCIYLCVFLCRGELTKDQMLKNCLEQMKVCFMTCCREASKLDEAMAKHFHTVGQVWGSVKCESFFIILPFPRLTCVLLRRLTICIPSLLRNSPFAVGRG
jgi:hypothetical protein